VSTLELGDLAALSRHRWIVAMIAAVAARRGARFVELLHGLDISRESLTRALDQARAGGWIVRNPGHGHPLRPEYVLTDKGEGVAAAAAAIAAAQDELGIAPASLGRWSLPVLRLLSEGETRFNGLERTLAVSPRALALTLKTLADQGLTARAVTDGWPPATHYALTDRGEKLANAVQTKKGGPAGPPF
jgi:DNA-binding HxlR family transcriptional regulator